ncbi:hypothetical protein NB2BOR_A07420 [Bordetella parapertussis]|nr:hypothetical protein NB2BOR_A07420 [Bordetella parapertussis]
MVRVAICSVGPTRWPISLVTGCLEMIDVPRSPDASCVIQVRNCTVSGSVRPSDLRMFSIWAGVAESPAMMAAASPGVRRSSRNTNTATITTTGIVASTRRRM